MVIISGVVLVANQKTLQISLNVHSKDLFKCAFNQIYMNKLWFTGNSGPLHSFTVTSSLLLFFFFICISIFSTF